MHRVAVLLQIRVHFTTNFHLQTKGQGQGQGEKKRDRGRDKG